MGRILESYHARFERSRVEKIHGCILAQEFTEGIGGAGFGKHIMSDLNMRLIAATIRTCELLSNYGHCRIIFYCRMRTNFDNENSESWHLVTQRVKRAIAKFGSNVTGKAVLQGQ